MVGAIFLRLKVLIVMVSGMKQEKEKIDLLLERNASEQLAGINWDGLNADISERLNQADRSKTYTINYRRVFKIASGIAAAAAIVFIAVTIRTDTPTTVRFENGRRAEVKFSESKGSATVEILDFNGQKSQSENRAAWIIIRTREPEVADNGQSRDEADFACLM